MQLFVESKLPKQALSDQHRKPHMYHEKRLEMLLAISEAGDTCSDLITQRLTESERSNS